MAFVVLAPVRLLRSNMAVLYHVNGKLQRAYRAFSHDVTAAILVFQNNGTAAMLVYLDNPVGVEFFSYVKTFFSSNKLA